MTRRDNHDGIAAVRADALVNLLTGTGADRVAVKLEVLVDIDQLTSGGEAQGGDVEGGDVEGDDAASADGSVCEISGTRIAPDVARRLGCDAQIASLIQDSAGNPLLVGRETRVVPRRIRRALNLRDQNRCQFLGCDATRRLHAHHIVHWANGGPTELPNLVLVCNFHHHLLHEHGWSIETNPQGGHRWVTPSGETATTKVSSGRLADLAGHTDPGLIHRLSGDSLRDLSWVTTALIHNEALQKARRTT